MYYYWLSPTSWQSSLCATPSASTTRRVVSTTPSLNASPFVLKLPSASSEPRIGREVRRWRNNWCRRRRRAGGFRLRLRLRLLRRRSKRRRRWWWCLLRCRRRRPSRSRPSRSPPPPPPLFFFFYFFFVLLLLLLDVVN